MDAGFYQRWLSDQLRSRGRRRGIGCGTEIAGSVGVFQEEIKMALDGVEELLTEGIKKPILKGPAFRLAPREGLEPPTQRLTAACSTN